jgi:hypothetical protein
VRRCHRLQQRRLGERLEETLHRPGFEQLGGMVSSGFAVMNTMGRDRRRRANTGCSSGPLIPGMVMSSSRYRVWPRNGEARNSSADAVAEGRTDVGRHLRLRGPESAAVLDVERGHRRRRSTRQRAVLLLTLATIVLVPLGYGACASSAAPPDRTRDRDPMPSVALKRTGVVIEPPFALQLTWVTQRPQLP